jgi:hypothetical protein
MTIRSLEQAEVSNMRSNTTKWRKSVGALLLCSVITFACLGCASDNSQTQASPSETTVPSVTQDVQIGLENPIVSYENFEALKAAIPFPFSIPNSEKWKTPCDLISFETISGTMVQLVFVNPDKNIAYRTAQGTEKDISGVERYPVVDTIEVDSTSVTLEGEEDRYFKALWTKNDYSYSIYSHNGLDEENFISIIKSIEEVK